MSTGGPAKAGTLVRGDGCPKKCQGKLDCMDRLSDHPTVGHRRRYCTKKNNADLIECAGCRLTLLSKEDNASSTASGKTSSAAFRLVKTGAECKSPDVPLGEYHPYTSERGGYPG